MFSKERQVWSIIVFLATQAFSYEHKNAQQQTNKLTNLTKGTFTTCLPMFGFLGTLEGHQEESKIKLI